MTKVKMISLDDQTARIRHGCSNPFCDGFIEIPNKFNICLNCFNKLIEIMGSIHNIFNYDESPPHIKISQRKVIKYLALKEHKTILNHQNELPKIKNKGVLTVEKEVKRNV